MNKVIGEILQRDNNKQSLGIVGYLTNGLYDRANVDSEAVVSSLIPFIYHEQREKLNQYIQKIENKNLGV